MDEDILYREFGVNAEILIDHANGIEPCLMEDIKAYKTQSRSLSSSQILPHDYSYIDAKVILQEMLQNGCYDMFRERVVTSLIHIIIGYGDTRDDFAKGTVRIPITTNLYTEIEPYVSSAWDKLVDRSRPIRKIGYDFAELQPEIQESYDLFTDMKKVSKQKALTKSILSIRDTYGKNALLKGIDLLDSATIRERNGMVGGHRG